MDYLAILAEMAKNPPDPNAPLPLSNKPATMIGATLTFHILAWAAVLYRLHVRFFKIRDPGWDDLFVILAAIFNFVAQVCIFGAVHWGLGKQIVSIDLSDVKNTLHWVYVQFASYYTTAAFIKISLLCQYLRLFKGGVLRSICIGLLVIVSLWGAAYAFMTWVPCFPPKAFWDRTGNPGATCYGFGLGTVGGARAAYISFASTNAALDVAIFMLPLALYIRPSLHKRQTLAIVGLFGLGAVVVIMSFLRLWTILKYQRSPSDAINFTWWYPLALIVSCLEINFAIMCASMPIFWPIFVQSMSQMFVVTKEVEVRVEYEDRLGPDTPQMRGEEFEMSRPPSIMKMSRPVSVRSVRPDSLKSGGSEERLTRRSEKSWYDDSPEFDYSGSYKSIPEVSFAAMPEIEAFPEVPKTPKTPKTPHTVFEYGSDDATSMDHIRRWETSRL